MTSSPKARWLLLVVLCRNPSIFMMLLGDCFAVALCVLGLCVISAALSDAIMGSVAVLDVLGASLLG